MDEHCCQQYVLLQLVTSNTYSTGNIIENNIYGVL
jgi:hypothetical protein